MQYKQAKHDEKKIYKNKITKSMSCNLIMLYIVLYIRYRRRAKDLSGFFLLKVKHWQFIEGCPPRNLRRLVVKKLIIRSTCTLNLKIWFIKAIE